MEREPLISIALCTYNGEKFLREQLDSVISQTYRNLEIIVVDDRSSDETVRILDDYARQDGRFNVFINEENLGYTKNFAKALSLCTGAFIAICDQDDVWRDDKISLQLKKMPGHELVYHDSEFIDENGVSMHYRISDKFHFYRGREPEVFLFLNCVSGHSVMINRSLLKETLPFPDGFHYDQWLAFIATSRGPIDFIQEPLVKYRQHRKNSTDILAIRTKGVKVDQSEKITRLWMESEWLKFCSEKAPHSISGAVYKLSLQRNTSFISIAYFMLIWKHRSTLLFLLKKSEVSKFFYTLRKAWGEPAKHTS